MTSDDCSDDELLSKLRGSFLDAPTTNQAWEELRNLRQKENELIAAYTYQWGHALVMSLGIFPEKETQPHIIKDFISSLQWNIRNKNGQQMGRDEKSSMYCPRSFQPGQQDQIPDPGVR